jgi:hypothetical protein
MWYLYTMEFYSATKENENFSFASKWMELENIILSEVSLAQKAKIICSPSYGDYRPDTCSNIIGHGSHTKGRMCMVAKIGKGKETQNLNVVNVPTV